MLKKISSGFCALMILAGVLLPASTGATGSIGDVGAWQTTTDLPVSGITQTATASYNSYMYVIGGADTASGSWSADVLYAHIKSDGSFDSWQTAANPLPTALNNESAVAYNGYLYVIGGDSNGGHLDTVNYAALNNDGSLGAWQTANHLPVAIADGGAVVTGGYVYLLGGNDNNVNLLATVYYAKLNSNGSLGAWQTASNGLTAVSQFISAITYNGYIYIEDTNGGNYMIYAKTNSDGSIGTWTTAGNQPTHAEFESFAGANGYLYVYGGRPGMAMLDTVQSATLNSDGSIGNWATSTNTMNTGDMMMTGLVANGYLYGVGGLASPSNSIQYAPLNFVNQSVANSSSGSIEVNTPIGTNMTCSGTAATEASQAHQDSGYDYPLGLVKYCFTTTDLNNQVSVTFVTNLSPTQVVARDYNETTGQYQTIPGATVTQTTYNGQAALKLTYTIKDGGPFDEDGTENGSITDPVGLAVAVNTPATGITAPNTGYGAPQSNHLAIFLIVAGTTSLLLGLRRYKTN